MSFCYSIKQTEHFIDRIGAFRPFPTIQIEPFMEYPVPRIIYAAAENLFRLYPLNLPLLICQFHDHHIGYDVFIERTHYGWNEWVNAYSVYPSFEKISIQYMVDELECALQQEKEMTYILPEITNHVNMLFRALGI